MASVANNFDCLPENIILEIFSYLPVKELCLVGRVCRKWRRIARDNTLWKHVNLTPYKLNLLKTWKVVRSHFSDCLISLQLRGDIQTIKDKNPVSEAMFDDLNERCPSIRHLALYDCKLQNLKMKLPSTLTSIKIIHSQWKPRWFKGIHTLIPSLKSLVLEQTIRVDNHDMDDISKISGLEILNTNACYRINEKGLEKVATLLTNLNVLEIAHCQCTDLILHHLSRNLKKLKTLNIRGSKVTDSGISTLIEGIPDLQHLNIQKCDLLMAPGLECLLCAKKLKTLVCNTTHLTPDVENRLEDMGCTITTLDSGKH